MAVPLTFSPVLAPSADGRLELFVVGQDGNLYHIKQTTPSGGWSDWFSHGHPLFSSLIRGPALAPSADGRLELFNVGQDGSLQHIWQTALSNGWSDWFSHGRSPASTLDDIPGLAPSADGRLELFVLGSDHNPYHISQTTPSDGWTNWDNFTQIPSSLGLAELPKLAPSADGRLELFDVGVDGNLYHIWQTTPSGGWSVWFSHGRPTPGTLLAAAPALAPSADGRLELFVVGQDGNLYHIWQTALSNGWSDWFSHGRPSPSGVESDPGLAPSADGRLELFVVGHDGNLYHIKQTTPSGTWTGWDNFGQP